ncbi:MAG: cytochrome c family protein [Litoreibacter sp.]|nr:cytochrome c family protein [Litoreibacter sp.]
MFDTMTFTKVLGAFCGTFLLYLLGGFAAEKIYHTGGGHGKHGEEHVQGYLIPVEGGEEEAEPEPEIDFMEVLASADAGKGEGMFNKCKACHKLDDGANGVGPHLYSLVNREIGVVDGFGYSEVLATSGEAWTEENLNAFLENPKGWAPGTKMNFNGLRKIEDRANLIAYLQTIGS